MIAHLVNRVNGLHDPVLEELEVTEIDRIVHAVVLQVLVAQTLLCSGQVANPNSFLPAWLELQLVVLKLTVKAEVRATVCRSMSGILHSPVAKLNVADLDKHWEHKDAGHKEYQYETTPSLPPPLMTLIRERKPKPNSIQSSDLYSRRLINPSWFLFGVNFSIQKFCPFKKNDK